VQRQNEEAKREREDFLFHFFLNHSLGLISEKKKSRRKKTYSPFLRLRAEAAITLRTSYTHAHKIWVAFARKRSRRYVGNRNQTTAWRLRVRALAYLLAFRMLISCFFSFTFAPARGWKNRARCGIKRIWAGSRGIECTHWKYQRMHQDPFYANLSLITHLDVRETLRALESRLDFSALSIL
jgi:hypothetical protein